MTQEQIAFTGNGRRLVKEGFDIYKAREWCAGIY